MYKKASTVHEQICPCVNCLNSLCQLSQYVYQDLSRRFLVYQRNRVYYYNGSCLRTVNIYEEALGDQVAVLHVYSSRKCVEGVEQSLFGINAAVLIIFLLKKENTVTVLPITELNT